MKYYLVGVTGYSGSGKDTAADMIGSYLGSPHEKLRMATALKAFFTISTGMPFDQEDRSIYHKLAKGFEPLTVRDWLVEVGMALRAYDKEFQIKTWKRLFAEMMQFHRHKNLVVFTIPDIRFPNEADMVRNLGGKIVEVQGKKVIDNPAELGPDTIKPDIVVNNSGSIQDLWKACNIASKLIKAVEYEGN